MSEEEEKVVIDVITLLGSMDDSVHHLVMLQAQMGMDCNSIVNEITTGLSLGKLVVVDGVIYYTSSAPTE